MRELPKGIRLTKGYIQVRIFHKGHTYCRNFGKDSLFARELAEIHLAEKRKEILMGKFGVTPELPSKKFEEVADLWFSIWSTEKDAEGNLVHTLGGINFGKDIYRRILYPYFKRFSFETIRPKDVHKWRLSRLEEVQGTSANREQAVLSSLFSCIERWVKTERIKPFKIPPENPCKSVQKAPTQKRERILSLQELGLLKQACHQLKDPPLWEVCKIALKSLLRKKDLMRLEQGLKIDMIQAKTGNRINIPVQILTPLNYVNLRRRWESAKKSANLIDCQFRDLRKTGANLLKQKNWSNTIISEVLGHASTATTEVYMVPDTAHLQQPLKDLANVIDAI